MVGQSRFLEKIKYIIEQDKFPKSCIFYGPRGSGKKLLAVETSKLLGYNIVQPENSKMETIKSTLELIHEILEPTIYVIPNLDDAQFRVKYSLLKILEEQPNNAYFIITCTNLENLYSPIKSRCQIFTLDRYTPEDLKEYCLSFNLSEEEILNVQDYCETPYDINLMLSYGIQEFKKYVELVINNVYKVQECNSFKTGSKLSFKKDSEGYDLELFFKVAAYLFFKNRDFEHNLNAVKITEKYLTDLSYPSINKQMLFDMWILDIREEFRNGC